MCTQVLASLLSVALLWGQSSESELRAHLDQAEKALQQGDVRGAAEAQARLGMLYRRLGKLSEAVDSFQRALRLEPSLPRVNVLLAFAYLDAGRYQEAIPLLAKSFDEEKQQAISLVVGQRLVECYLATGDQDNALAVVQKLRQIAPDDADVLYLASKVYMSSWNGAFQRLLARAPGSYQVRLIQAEALEAQERFSEAAQEYRQIVKLAPQLPGIHYKLARMILRGEAADADQKALEELRRELEINPLDAPSLAESGEIHLRAGRLEEASRGFSQALKLQPGYVPARVGLAKVLIAGKQWSQALEHLEAAAQAAPEEEAVAYHRMLAYRGLGRAAEAKQAFETFQRLKQQKGRPPQ